MSESRAKKAWLLPAIFGLALIAALVLFVMVGRGHKEAPPAMPQTAETAQPTQPAQPAQPAPVEPEADRRASDLAPTDRAESQRPHDDKLEQTDARLEEMQARAARLKHEIRALDGVGNKAGAAQRTVMLKRLEAEMQRVRAARP